MDIDTDDANVQMVEDEPPVIEPQHFLFDEHMSPTLDANIERITRKYGFFIPDQEYLVDKEGFLGYCHESLYCQKLFSTW
jgi:pre-60S factor REI1